MAYPTRRKDALDSAISLARITDDEDGEYQQDVVDIYSDPLYVLIVIETIKERINHEKAS